jgi:hypothetical protein
MTNAKKYLESLKKKAEDAGVVLVVLDIAAEPEAEIYQVGDKKFSTLLDVDEYLDDRRLNPD